MFIKKDSGAQSGNLFCFVVFFFGTGYPSVKQPCILRVNHQKLYNYS